MCCLGRATQSQHRLLVSSDVLIALQVYQVLCLLAIMLVTGSFAAAMPVYDFTNVAISGKHLGHNESARVIGQHSSKSNVPCSTLIRILKISATPFILPLCGHPRPHAHCSHARTARVHFEVHAQLITRYVLRCA